MNKIFKKIRFTLGLLALVALSAGGIAVVTWLSTRPVANLIYIEQTPWRDLCYFWMDPFAIFLCTGIYVCGLLLWPQHLQLWKMDRFPLFKAIIALAITTIFCEIIERSLKKSIGRARPATRIEHALIAEFLRDRAFLERYHLSPNDFKCPIAKHLKNPQSTDEQIVAGLIKDGMEINQARKHLSDIYNHVGLTAAEIPIEEKARLLVPMNKRFRDNAGEPFIERLIESVRQRDICDLSGAAPSGHILRQSSVAFLGVIVVFLFHKNIPLFRIHPSLRWILLGLLLFGLVAVGWSRIYGFHHSLSDELLSILVTWPLFGFATGVLYVATSQRLTGLFPTPSGTHLLDSAKVMVMYLHCSKTILIWNSECEKVTGYTAEEMRTLDDYIKLYPYAAQQTIKNDILQGFSNKTEVKDYFTVIKDKSQRKKALVWNATYLEDVFGKAIGKLAVGVEVSHFDRRLVDIGLATAILLHEIRDDLLTVKIAAQRALRNHPQDENLVEIAKIAETAEITCSDFRDYAKGTADVRTEFDAHSLITFSYRILNPVAIRKRIKLKTVISNKPIILFGFESLLKHVIVGLVRNAITALENHEGQREIRIESRIISNVKESMAEIKVIDSGPGLPKHVAQQVNGVKSSATIKAGMRIQGLGLILAASTAEEHGGRLEYSFNAGESIFTVKLPIVINEHGCTPNQG